MATIHLKERFLFIVLGFSRCWQLFCEKRFDHVWHTEMLIVYGVVKKLVTLLHFVIRATRRSREIPTILMGGDTPPIFGAPEGPAAGAKRPHAGEGRQGERSETVVPEATD